MPLSDSEASTLVSHLLSRLQELGATDLIAGIDESRRLGIDEAVPPPQLATRTSRVQRPEVGSTRRRPLTDRELLSLILDRLGQRVVTVPAIARTLQSTLGDTELHWRVDTNFARPDRVDDEGFLLSQLLPTDLEAVEAQWQIVRRLAHDVSIPTR